MTTPNDPGPARTPDLEPGGGVAPGATPPDSPQTSGLSAPEPPAQRHFPATLILIPVAAVALLALAAAVLIL